MKAGSQDGPWDLPRRARSSFLSCLRSSSHWQSSLSMVGVLRFNYILQMLGQPTLQYKQCIIATNAYPPYFQWRPILMREGLSAGLVLFNRGGEFPFIIKLNLTPMLNFASLFNQFRSQSSSGITDLLEQPGTRMGRLLDEDSFVNEYKSGNAKVQEFMRYDKFEELIEFVTVVGPPQDKKRGYKYPLAACDLLSIDNNIAIDFFFPDRPLTVDEKLTEEVEVEVEVDVEQFVEVPAPAPQTTENSEPAEGAVEEKKEEPAAEPAAEGEPEQQEIQPLNPPAEAAPQPVPPAEKVLERRVRKELRKETRKVERTVKREVEPLINKLMAYFDGEVNYTLAGYVSKILSLFFTKKPADFLRFFLQENIVEKVLNHAESRSVGELIVKILVNETTICLEQRKSFFKAILNKLSSSSEIYIMSNLSAYVSEIIEKVATNLKGNNKITEFNDVFFSLEAITQVIKNVISEEENVSIYNAPILFTYLTSVPFVLPEDEVIVAEFKKLLEHFVQKSCEKLTVTARSRPKLGTGRIKIIEILRFILKENILNTKDIVAKTDAFFPILIALFREYPLNNLLHNEIIKILEIALTEGENTPLNAAVLKDGVLLNFIIEEVEEDKKIKAGASVYKSRKGFIAHLINLSIKLREVGETNQNVKRAIEAPEFAKVYESFVEKELFNSKKSLAGFSMRKDIKHEIMFQKEDIIAAYVTFLQKCPSPVFEQEPEHVNIEHPDLVEELQKQLEENLTIKPKEEEKTVEEVVESLNNNKETKEPITEAEVINQPPSFWVVHLEYNVEDLMIDL